MGHRTTNLFTAFSQFLSLHNLKQVNNILNSNNRTLDLILITSQISANVSRTQFPLVPEDVHHPSLNINLVVNFELINPFARVNDLSKYDFRKADFGALYTSLASTDWTPMCGI